MINKFKISLVSNEDIAGIQRVLRETFLATFPNEELGITKEDVEFDLVKIASTEVVSTYIDRALKRSSPHQFLVAKDEETVVGISQASKKGDSVYWVALFVLPAYHGQGIGKGFWQEVLTFARDAKEIFVSVETYNHPAIGFYKKLGFIETGQRSSSHVTKSGVPVPEMRLMFKVDKSEPRGFPSWLW